MTTSRVDMTATSMKNIQTLQSIFHPRISEISRHAELKIASVSFNLSFDFVYILVTLFVH